MSEKLPLVVRIRSKLQPDGDCLVFSGHKNKDGYGWITANGKGRFVHREWWLAHGREIPPGNELDHLCRNPACVRLDHLEPVTHRENCLRGVSVVALCARKTHCKNGHEFTAENTRTQIVRGNTHRACRECVRQRQRLYKRRQRKASA